MSHVKKQSTTSPPSRQWNGGASRPGNLLLALMHDRLEGVDLGLRDSTVEEIEPDAFRERIAGLSVLREATVVMRAGALAPRITHARKFRIRPRLPFAIQILLRNAKDPVQDVCKAPGPVRRSPYR